jgi:hypothetical protein
LTPGFPGRYVPVELMGFRVEQPVPTDTMRRQRLVIFSAALVLAPAVARPQGPIGPEFRVNTVELMDIKLE